MKHDIYSGFDFMGIWWLPGNEPHRITATLSYTPQSGLKLSFIGSFGEEERFINVLHGFAPGHGRITLWRSHWVGAKVSDISDEESVHLSTYSVTACFFGSHLTRLENEHFTFSSVGARFSGFQNWVSKSGFDSEFDKNEKASTWSFQSPDEINATLGPIRVVVEHGLNEKPGRFNIVMKQSTSIRLVADSPISLTEWLTEYLAPIRNLISFATGKQSYLIHIEVLPEGDYGPDGAWRRYMPAIIQPWEQMPDAYQEYDLVDWFRNGVIWFEPNRWEEILNRWLMIERDLEPISHLFLRTVPPTDHPHYSETEVLYAAQSLESFYERHRDTRIMSRKKAKDLKKAIKDVVPNNCQKAVADALIRIEYKPLDVRLREIFQEQSNLVGPIVGNIDTFISDITRTRNYWAHLSSSLATKRLRGLAAVDAAELLWMVMECYLLEELGYDRTAAQKMVMNTERYQDIGKRREMIMF